MGALLSPDRISETDRLAWAAVSVRYAPGVAVAGVREVSEAGSELQMLAAGAAQVTRCAAVVAVYSSRSEQSLQEQREAEAAGAARVAGGGCRISFMRWLQEQLESLAVGFQNACGSIGSSVAAGAA